jgi:hypothetical protein
MEAVETPQNGWWPEESKAPITQMLFRNGKGLANIVKSGIGWRAYSLVEMNKSGTSGKPLAAVSVETRLEAQRQAEEYSATLP